MPLPTTRWAEIEFQETYQPLPKAEALLVGEEVAQE
jgi:hypothetical protein